MHYLLTLRDSTIDDVCGESSLSAVYPLLYVLLYGVQYVPLFYSTENYTQIASVNMNTVYIEILATSQ